ncbi:class II glutamine amidotransferase [Limobrevibacterium gyesilva]|uniref:Class II glutamine amidotransferase n=1 Tax=Limobrevibacterium gyesilva TaxID=2991712 RepID=A0AA42CCD1_9PROT|nr:class II glutamine amidotransferase [Limobrevibacterium gyesilva]MCW3473133.1 class II glutamine amidotransferase [Limobrevibacterium gyesilva]
MCRFLAYRGQPILLEELVAAPAHSLIHQSLHAEEAKIGTNGDGFGVGWYGERTEPGLYREVRPAWSDENLRSICAQVRSGVFFAHVRASTGTAISRANCHPFAVGRFLFMHNGQIGGWPTVRRGVEAMIPDSLYTARQGTTDSEAILFAAMARGLEDDPVGAIAGTLGRVQALMSAGGVTAPLRFTAALTDGERLWAFRWASDARPPTLYWREDETGLVVVSEPIDGHRADWQAVPVGGCLTAIPGEAAALGCLEIAVAQAA